MKWLIAVLLLLLPVLVYADSSGEIVRIDIGEDKNISVWVQYKLDGIEIESNYPKIDDKFVYRFRIRYTNLVGKTNNQIRTYIRNQIERHCENIIKNRFAELRNEADLNDRISKIGGIIGSSLTKNSAFIDFDTDQDGANDTRWEVFTNGNYTETTIP